MEDAVPLSASRRAPRRDAAANRERLLQAALAVFARDGLQVPVAAVAEEAGLGIATLYRSFPDRHALMQELEHRAYQRLIEIIDGIETRGVRGVAAVQCFLVESLALADQLILPLHGAPPLVDDEAVAMRQRIDGHLEHFLAQARAVGAVRSDVNATDVIICSALITQPLRHGPHWELSATRHIALFVAGLAGTDPLPGPPVGQSDIENTFQSQARAPR
jgi:AcrR family transcriptional regulator